MCHMIVHCQCQKKKKAIRLLIDYKIEYIMCLAIRVRLIGICNIRKRVFDKKRVFAAYAIQTQYPLFLQQNFEC